MDFSELCQLGTPVPWEGRHKIPWNDVEFSQRMLAEHLDQSHDRASRRSAGVLAQVEFLEEHVLPSGGAVLDLGCGPGLHCCELGKRGFRCTGIDFAPAAIDYARRQDARGEYRLEDLCDAEFGTGFDLAMMLFGEFQTFAPPVAKLLLEQMRESVLPDGAVVLEVLANQRIKQIGEREASWRALATSVFKGNSHLLLQQNFWFTKERVSVARHIVVDESREIGVYTDTLQSYSDHELVRLLQETGFRRIQRQPSHSGDSGYYLMIGFC